MCSVSDCIYKVPLVVEPVLPVELVIKVIQLAMGSEDCALKDIFSYALVSTEIKEVVTEELQKKIACVSSQRMLLLKSIEEKTDQINKIADLFDIRLAQMNIIPDENDQKLLRDEYYFQNKKASLSAIEQTILQNGKDHDKAIQAHASVFKTYSFVLDQCNALKKPLADIAQMYQNCLSIETIKDWISTRSFGTI